ncbi:MAG: prolipoprotein diacylglyceryl transferase [Phycisphaerales bacterium]|nr:MAG: prolipoprotein diacylglyceryl transferase [Phycisphaerales bacterium]
MYPELFEIPFVHLTVKSYGFMMVIGFLAAVSIIRYLSRDITPDPQLITNAALYSLIAGVVGARLFFVFHHFDQFRDNLFATLAIWKGGLELLGGVILAIPLIFFYLVYHKLPIRKYLDILAIGLMLALTFGRIGCFLNGCCYGKPTSLPWGVRFPYNSFAYVSQVNADPKRNRSEPQLELPRDEYLGHIYEDGKWYPKAFEELTEQQKKEVTEGKYRSLPVHPTQLYSSASGALSCLILYLFWRRSQKVQRSEGMRALLAKPGCTFALMFILYGVTRFLIEFVRDDNPFELAGLTISQLLNIGLITLGIALMAAFQKAKLKQPASIPKG